MTAKGVILEDGREISSDIVLSNATAKVTYLDLISQVVKDYSNASF